MIETAVTSLIIALACAIFVGLIVLSIKLFYKERKNIDGYIIVRHDSDSNEPYLFLMIDGSTKDFIEKDEVRLKIRVKGK